MAKQQRELMFLKSSGILIGEITPDTNREVLNLEKFAIRVVELDEELGEYWYGDHLTGEIRTKLDKPVVTESVVRYATNVQVLSEYPIHKQLNVLIDLLAQSDVPKTAEFTAMKEFLDQARQNFVEKVEYYSTNTDAYVWVSSEQEEAEATAKKQFE